MVASTVCDTPEEGEFQLQSVGNQGFLDRHNSQIFAEGRSFSGNERDKLFLNRGDGTFADLSDLSGCDSPGDGRGVICADLDDDGDLDLFVHEIQRERHHLYRNNLGGQFIKVRLAATSGQHEGIGATVIAHGPEGPVAQPLTRGAGFVSCQAPELVFGLGAAESARVEVVWPGGARENFGSIPANSRVLLTEGTGKASNFAAKPRPLPDPLPKGLRLRVGDALPPLAMLDASGELTTLDSVELADGGELWINLWGKSCVPCIKEMPLLVEHDASDGLRVVLLCTDPPQHREQAVPIAAKRAAGLADFYLGADSSSVLPPPEDYIDLLRLPIPTTLRISPEGKLLGVMRGTVPPR